FDRDSGETTWKAGDDLASYASPIVIGEGERRQVVFLTAGGVVSLQPNGGAVNWSYPLKDPLFESSPTPALPGDFLIAPSITFGSAGLGLSAKDGKPAAEVWKEPKLTSYFTTPVAVGKDHLFLVSSTISFFGGKRAQQADLHCVEAATGKSLWKREKVGRY